MVGHPGEASLPQQQLWGAQTPSSGHPHSPTALSPLSLEDLCWRPCLAVPWPGGLELTPDPGKRRADPCMALSAMFSAVSVPASSCLQHCLIAHVRCQDKAGRKGRWDSPIVTSSSTQVTAGSQKQQSRVIFCKTKGTPVTAWHAAATGKRDVKPNRKWLQRMVAPGGCLFPTAE